MTTRIIFGEMPSRLSSNFLNPAKDKRYPTPERRIPQIVSSDEIIIFSYDELVRKINDYPKELEGLVHANYEKHLKEDEFIKIFNMTFEDFYRLPKWSQINLKKKYKLF